MSLIYKHHRMPMIILVIAVFIVGAASAEGTRTISAATSWSIELTGDDVVSFFDVSKFGVHRSMSCALPYGDDGVVVYDSIEKKVTFFGRDGRPIWAEGQVGDGPEDHREPCELSILDDGRIVLISLSPPVKVVFYGDDGQYLGSQPLHGLHGAPRLVYSLRNTYVLKAGFNYEENSRGETDWTYSIETVDESGLPVASRFIKSATTPRRFRPGMVIKERDLWHAPRIEPGPRGTVVVQPDVYEPDVDVYDRELERIAQIEGGWTPPTQSEEYRQAMALETDGAKVAAETLRALPHLFCFDNREIWLQKRMPDSSLVFAAYNAHGEDLGYVHLVGIEGSIENMALLGRTLLTFEEIEDGTGGLSRQVFRVYRLDG
jgi:hypothetical protein